MKLSEGDLLDRIGDRLFISIPPPSRRHRATARDKGEETLAEIGRSYNVSG
jgi:hypothetical protein